MAGALLTLFETMVTSEILAGVTQRFGEENQATNDGPPRVVWSPDTTQFVDSNGVGKVMQARDMIEAHLWAASTLEGAEAQHHADAVEELRERVLQALQAQKWVGYFFRPTRGRWKPSGTREFGREYTLTIEAFVPIRDVAPTTATVLTVPIAPEFGT